MIMMGTTTPITIPTMAIVLRIETAGSKAWLEDEQSPMVLLAQKGWGAEHIQRQLSVAQLLDVWQQEAEEPAVPAQVWLEPKFGTQQ